MAVQLLRPDPIRVLIVDDNPITRLGLGIFFELQDDMVVVGEGCNGQEGVDLCRRLLPGVVLMDLMMPVMDGITATRIIRLEFPLIRVVVLTSGMGGDSPTDVFEAGASAYCTKNTTGNDLANAIRGR